MLHGRHAVHLRPELLAATEGIRDLPLLLVTGPGGSGKSTLLSAWAEQLDAEGIATAWIDLSPLHASTGSFLEEFAGEIVRAVPPEPGVDGFGATLLRRLPHLESPDPDSLARLLASEFRELAEPIVVFLDDYHRLPQGSSVDQLLGHVLRDRTPYLHLVVATRGAAPSAAARMLAEGRAVEVGADDLSLRADQVMRVLADRGVDLPEDLLALLLARTGGWATGVLLAARAISTGRAGDVARFVADLASQEDLFAYVASELLAGEPDEVLRLIETAALLGPARRDVLERLAGPGAPERVDDALGRGLLLREGGRVGLHQLWEGLLRERLRRRLDPRELRDGAERAVEALERVGEPERAIELCIELDQPKPGIALLERYGLDWIERGHHDAVSRWLAELAPPAGGVLRETPDLALVRALLDARRDVARAIDALESAADRLRERGDLERELAARHNALILAANENLDHRARSIALQIVRPRRLVASREARSTALLFVAVGALLDGRYRIARRLLERIARQDFPPRERGGLTLARAQIAIAAGEWERAVALTEESLSDASQRSHGPSYFGLRSMRAFARGVLGREVEECLAQIEEANDAFRDFRLAVSEAEGRVFSAQLLLRDGQAERALEELERAGHLYEQLHSNEGQANLDSVLARAQRAVGNNDAARHHAATSLEAHARTRGLRRRPWSSAIAAWVLAEAGQVDDARAFVRNHARLLDAPALPASQHATHLALGRIAELAGDEEACMAHLVRAHSAAAAADLRAPLPDADAELLAWAHTAARARGLEQRVAERFERPADDEQPDTPLRILTLGVFRVERDGTPIESRAWRGSNARRLFQRLLVAEGRPVSRELLGVELWPDASPANARGSLRAALMRLRRALDPGRAAGDPERWLQIDGEDLAVRDETLAAWDVAQWRTLLAQAEQADAETGLALRCRAVREYAGPFLPDTFEDWALEVRRHLEARFAQVGREVIRDLLARDRPAEASALADCLLAQDRADEAAWVAKIEAELARGDRHAAGLAVDGALAALRRELEAGPGPELEGLARSLGVHTPITRAE